MLIIIWFQLAIQTKMNRLAGGILVIQQTKLSKPKLKVKAKTE